MDQNLPVSCIQGILKQQLSDQFYPRGAFILCPSHLAFLRDTSLFS